jgi:hypothetical protein
MFDSLDEQIKKSQDRESTSKQRMMRYVLYGLTGAVLFGALIYGVHMLS